MAVQPVILTTPRGRDEHVDIIAAALTGMPGLRTPMIYSDEAGEGAAAATCEALRTAGASGDHVLFLEDDVLVDAMAPAVVAAADFPDGVAVICYCDMREVPQFSAPGLYRRSALGSDRRGWWGNQALLVHRETAAMLSERDWFSPDIEDQIGIRAHKVTYGDDGRNCSDIRLSLLVHLYGGDRRDYAVHVPSLFKHVGHDSMCFPGRAMGERETRNWIEDRRRYGIDSAERSRSAMI